MISLIHERRSKEDIARGLHRSIAIKVLSIVRKVGIEEEITFTGGVALNSGVVAEMRDVLGLPVNVPEQPQFVGSLGAALLAWKEALAGPRNDPVRM